MNSQKTDQINTARSRDNQNPANDNNGDGKQPLKSLLKFEQFSSESGIHKKIGEMIDKQVDSIAVERELEIDDEDTLIEKKKDELKKWFVHNYQHELN